jgi:hypothetical protein
LETEYAEGERLRIFVSRIYWKLLLSLVLAFLALTTAARALGNIQPPNPGLAGFNEGCANQPQPCWHGIVPGITSANEVIELMAFAGEPELSRSIFSRDYILTFSLPETRPYCRASFEFVNDVVVRGEVSICGQRDVQLGELALMHEHDEKTVSLPPHEQIYGRVSVNISGWPSPFSRIDHINLLAPNARFQHFPWLGFVSQRLYCQHVPEYPLCP